MEQSWQPKRRYWDCDDVAHEHTPAASNWGWKSVYRVWIVSLCYHSSDGRSFFWCSLAPPTTHLDRRELLGDWESPGACGLDQLPWVQRWDCVHVPGRTPASSSNPRGFTAPKLYPELGPNILQTIDDTSPSCDGYTKLSTILLISLCVCDPVQIMWDSWVASKSSDVDYLKSDLCYK